MQKQKKCNACNKLLSGRSDKKFCDSYCKSSYHYQKSIENTPNFYTRVDKQLKTNRRILKNFNRAGKATVRSDILIKKGFNPDRKSTRLNSSHVRISYAVFCL